ncbi:MAG: glycosyltransferase family 2 protein [Bacteriovoracaceae bacterium]|nr:glycosyltransferase family 2 protein [Bacteriovoracaceae bacterium]
MSGNKISVVIIALNNDQTIERTLKSASGFDQIVVIDGGSTDNTVELSKQYGAKVVTNAFKGFLEQRNFSLTQADHDWCLVVDSDEEISNELKEKLYKIISDENAKVLYRIFRTEYLLGRENEHGYNRSFYQERFFLKSKVTYAGDLHEYPLIDGVKPSFDDPHTVNLPSEFRLHHNPNNNISMMLMRFPKYTILKANDKIAKGRKVFLIELLMTMPTSFIRIFLRRWRAGRIAVFEGLVEATTRMFIKLLIYEKELIQKEKKKLTK